MNSLIFIDFLLSGCSEVFVDFALRSTATPHYYAVKVLLAEIVIIVNALITVYFHWLNRHAFNWPPVMLGT